VVVSLDEAARMASELPEVTEGERDGNLTWLACAPPKLADDYIKQGAGRRSRPK
jgi:hypothetical protein